MANVPTKAEIAKLCKQINDRYLYINDGGCCVFAAILGHHMQKMFPTKVRVESEAGVNISRIRRQLSANTLQEWTFHDVWFDHVVLEVTIEGETLLLDSRGFVPHAEYKSIVCGPILDGHISVADAQQLANETDWNDMFDRKHIPTIKHTVDQFFAGYDNCTVV